MATRVRRVLAGTAVLLTLVGIVIVFNNLNHQSKSRADGAPTGPTPAATPLPKFRHVPVHEKIATGQVVVRANGWVQYRMIVNPEMQEPTVTGSFKTHEGTRSQAVPGLTFIFPRHTIATDSDGRPQNELEGRAMQLRRGLFAIGFSPSVMLYEETHGCNQVK